MVDNSVSKMKVVHFDIMVLYIYGNHTANVNVSIQKQEI